MPGVELYLADCGESWEYAGAECRGSGDCWRRRRWGPQGEAGGDAGAAGSDWGFRGQGRPGRRGAGGGGGGGAGTGVPGDYGSATNYALGDVVLWQGASYASLVEGNHGNTPSFSPGQWGVLTAQGPPGVWGAQGSGRGGAAGAAGSVGPPGERGTQGLQGIPGQAGPRVFRGLRVRKDLAGRWDRREPRTRGTDVPGGYSSTANYALADGVLYGARGMCRWLPGTMGIRRTRARRSGLVCGGGRAGRRGPRDGGGTGPRARGWDRGRRDAGGDGSQRAAGPCGGELPGELWRQRRTMRCMMRWFRRVDVRLAGGGNNGNTPGLARRSGRCSRRRVRRGRRGGGCSGSGGRGGGDGAPGAAGPQGPPVSFAGGWRWAGHMRWGMR